MATLRPVASLRVQAPLAMGRSPVTISRLGALQATVRLPGMVLSPAWAPGEGCLPTQEV